MANDPSLLTESTIPLRSMSSNPPLIPSDNSRKGATAPDRPILRHLLCGGIFFFLPLLISACTTPEASPPVPSPPSLHPSRASVDRVMSALASGDFSQATTLLKRMPSTREKTLLTSLLVNEEKNVALSQALRDLSRPSEQTLNLSLERLYGLSRKSYYALFASLSASRQKTLLRELIRNGKERLAIRTLRHAPSLMAKKGALIAEAYVQWAERREREKRLFDARGLARQALKIAPDNLKAASIERRIERLRKQKITQGLLAYRHRHLHQAIRLWEEAQAIDPSQKEPKRYILKARAILEKIRSLAPPPK